MRCKNLSSMLYFSKHIFALAHTAIFCNYVNLQFAFGFFFLFAGQLDIRQILMEEQTRKQGISFFVSEIISRLCINKNTELKKC